jgi:hypothetical protein
MQQNTFLRLIVPTYKMCWAAQTEIPVPEQKLLQKPKNWEYNCLHVLSNY